MSQDSDIRLEELGPAAVSVRKVEDGEPPMELTPQDCEELIALCRKVQGELNDPNSDFVKQWETARRQSSLTKVPGEFFTIDEVVMLRFLAICQPSLDPDSYEDVCEACTVLCTNRQTLSDDSLEKCLQMLSG